MCRNRVTVDVVFLVVQAAKLAAKRKMAPAKIKKMYVLAGLLVSERKSPILSDNHAISRALSLSVLCVLLYLTQIEKHHEHTKQRHLHRGLGQSEKEAELPSRKKEVSYCLSWHGRICVNDHMPRPPTTDPVHTAGASGGEWSIS